jgi:uncharacterized protein (TIGR02217 family)
MSNQVFPELVGISWPIEREAIWSTEIKEALSGREYRSGYMSAPRYRYFLKCDVLFDEPGSSDLHALMGFFNQHRGRLFSFRFWDRDDCSVTDEQFYVADGTTKDFQLTRARGGFVEPVFEIKGTPVIKANGVAISSGYTLAAGLLSFATAPAQGTVLRWTGEYYWRMRFNTDTQRFTQFLRRLWETKAIELITTRT